MKNITKNIIKQCCVINMPAVSSWEDILQQVFYDLGLHLESGNFLEKGCVN